MRKIKFRAWDSKGQVGMVDEPILDVVFNDERYEIMQFTGLKDKNDKEIYEGDILEYDDPEEDSKAVVFFEQGKFRKQYIRQEDWDGKCDIDSVDLEGMHVIGNIYENPELLNEETNTDTERC